MTNLSCETIISSKFFESEQVVQAFLSHLYINWRKFIIKEKEIGRKKKKRIFTCL